MTCLRLYLPEGSSTTTRSMAIVDSKHDGQCVAAVLPHCAHGPRGHILVLWSRLFFGSGFQIIEVKLYPRFALASHFPGISEIVFSLYITVDGDKIKSWFSIFDCTLCYGRSVQVPLNAWQGHLRRYNIQLVASDSRLKDWKSKQNVLWFL